MLKELIENRIENFWGYGNLDSDYWFILMNEGTEANSIEDKDLRIRFEKARDKHVLDCYKDMKDVKEHMDFYSEEGYCRGKNPHIQQTIGKVIRVLLSIKRDDFIYKDEKYQREEIRYFQCHNFGRKDSTHCNLYLMPLLNNKDIWIYDSVDLPYLKSKDDYDKTIMCKRITCLKKLIKEHTPQVIIFYSDREEYLEKWKIITPARYTKICEYFWHASSNGTNFFILPHPRAHKKGLNTKAWNNFGQKIKERLTH